MKKQLFPWAQLFYLAVGECKLSVHDFWDLTISELLWLQKCYKQHINGAFTISKDELSELMQQFPDN